MKYPALLLLFLLWCAPDALAVTRIETFNCANADDIDCNFTWADDPFTASGDLHLTNVSGTQRVEGETNGLVADDPRLQVDLGTATVEVTALVTVAQPTSGTNLIGPALRMNAAAVESYCGCAVTVNNVAQEFLRAAEVDNGVQTQGSCPITYAAGAAATVMAEMTAGSTLLTCTYDPGGANEEECTFTCDIPETNFVGIYVNQNTGPAGSISIDNFTPVTPDSVGGQVFQW